MFDIKEKGLGQRICTPVSQWFHTFLASGKCPSSEKCDIGNNTSHLLSFTDESESTLSDNLDIEFGPHCFTEFFKGSKSTFRKQVFLDYCSINASPIFTYRLPWTK